MVATQSVENNSYNSDDALQIAREDCRRMTDESQEEVIDLTPAEKSTTENIIGIVLQL